MGSLYKGVCYPDLPIAKQQICADQSLSWGSGKDFMTAECLSTNFALSTMSICKRTNGGACVTTAPPYPVLTPCDYSGTSDLAYEWFLMAMGLLVVVWGGKQLLRLFENHQDKD